MPHIAKRLMTNKNNRPSGQVRRHIEFNMDDNEAVRDKLTAFTMARTI